MRSEMTPWTIRGMGLALGALFVYGLVQLGIAAGGVFLLFFAAVLLASALEPIVGSLRDHLPLGRGATILVVYASFFATVLALALVVVPAAIHQAETIIKGLPPFFEETRRWAGTLRPAALATSVKAFVASVADVFKLSPATAPTQVAEVGAAVAEAAVALGTLLTLVYFWLVEHARIQRYVLAYLPAERRAGARDAWNEIETRLGLWVRGELILMGTMGAATSVVYAILGLPGALILGLIAAVTEAIPIVGPSSAPSRRYSSRRRCRPSSPWSSPSSTSSSSSSRAACWSPWSCGTRSGSRRSSCS
jgi:predicted PurR-regulated permease PerM